MANQGNLAGFHANVVPIEDEEVSKHLERSFKKAGMTVMTSSRLNR